ncbi:hypothetical protein Ddye_008423 [Dipteronia dyeriana]|uniref:Uncharacterized protein n=1 Tax=Dipteronia dyeriana TaxID=168575 RepID=A0AAD9X9X6_9ROSI|nr:hypothetical protein Ddye_008423 [Dipteronia dyeriana]
MNFCGVEVVLSNDMNVEKNFPINILSHEEAENLFWKTVGDSAKKIAFYTIGIEIVHVFDWKDALDQLRRSNPRQIKGMDANVYSAINLSYDFLESEEAKSLFLLCSLYEASFNLSLMDLLKYCMGIFLFPDVSTMEQGRNRLLTLINYLKASSLLLDAYTNERVKMNSKQGYEIQTLLGILNNVEKFPTLLGTEFGIPNEVRKFQTRLGNSKRGKLNERRG